MVSLVALENNDDNSGSPFESVFSGQRSLVLSLIENNITRASLISTD